MYVMRATINKKKRHQYFFLKAISQMEPNYKDLYLAEQEKVKKYKQKCALLQKLILDAHDDGHLDTCDLCLSFIYSIYRQYVSQMSGYAV